MADIDNAVPPIDQKVLEKKEKKKNYKFIATLIFAFSFAIFLSFFAYKIDTHETVYPITYVICLTGCVLGWLVGIITTPYDNVDENKTSKFSKLIGTFISGYFLSKFDKVISSQLKGEAISPLSATRALLFISFFALAWIMTYVFRLYFTDVAPNVLPVKKSAKNSQNDII